jgi:hypothetical protein
MKKIATPSTGKKLTLNKTTLRRLVIRTGIKAGPLQYNTRAGAGC